MKKISTMMQEAVNNGVFPGAVLLVGFQGKIIFHEAYGHSTIIPQKKLISPETIFDLASLTKPMATTSAIMLLIESKLINLTDKLNIFFPSEDLAGKENITIFQLLNHSSGLPAWRPYYEKIKTLVPDNKNKIFSLIHQEKLIYTPGSKSLYSDLGFILLGEIIKKVTGQNLDEFCDYQIFKKLNLNNTSYINLFHDFPSIYQNKNIAATEDSSFRNKIICGEVHDDNAYIMGGVAGHAGVFSNTLDLFKFLKTISDCVNDKHDFLPAGLAKQIITKQNTSDSSWGLGWDTPSPEHSSAGNFFSKKSFGHLGYTGTSFWTDAEKELTVILLSNRVHPSSKNNLIKDFRPQLHNLIYQEVIA